MKKFRINVLQCRQCWLGMNKSICDVKSASWVNSRKTGNPVIKSILLLCASISIFSNEPMWRKVQSTYTVCGCAGVTKRLGPASENGPESSSNMLKPKGSLPNSPPPPIIPNKKHAQSINCHMTNYELLR